MWRYGVRFAVAACAFILSAGAAHAQFVGLSPAQLAALQQQILDSLESAVDGSAIIAGTLPPDRLESAVPSYLLTEADPVAAPTLVSHGSRLDVLEAVSVPDVADVTANTAGVAANTAAISANDSDISTLQTDVGTWTDSIVYTNVWVTDTVTVFDGDNSTNVLSFVNGMLDSITPHVP